MGGQVRLGGVEIDVFMQTPRCAMPGRGQGPVGLDRDKKILTTLRDEHENNLGVYASVVTPGRSRWATRSGALDRTVNRQKGFPPMYPAADQPLRIAFLAYRGKPHVGGQGVYTRHLTKALVDLGHHVEVLGGQPFPILDERVPLIELPSLDIYNDYFPMRMPGVWELKQWPDFVEVTAFSTGTFPEPLAFSMRAWDHLRKRTERVRSRPRQPEPRLRPAAHPARLPTARHHPPPDHGRSPTRALACADALSTDDAAPVVRVHEDAVAGGAATRADRDGLRVEPSRHREGSRCRREPDAHRAGRCRS